MYIKFCRSYVEDKKDEAKENLQSKLSVELEGEKGKQAEGKIHLYRVACVFLSIICLILLLAVIVLSVKFQTKSAVCQAREKAVRTGENRESSLGLSTCDYKQCQAHFPDIQPHLLGCQQCKDGWLTFGRSCFFLSTFRMSWDQSQKNCTARGASLAVISDLSIQMYLTKKGNLNYWIGLKHNRNAWTWVNNTVLRESYWADNLLSGDCGMIKSEDPPEKNWIRASCNSYGYFICQLQY